MPKHSRPIFFAYSSKWKRDYKLFNNQGHTHFLQGYLVIFQFDFPADVVSFTTGYIAGLM